MVSNGDGFSIIATGISNPSQATITSYDVSGRRLSSITNGFTSNCGEADVIVPGRGRLIITELISQTAAEGLQGATQSAALTAWNASTGAKVWSAPIDPSDGQPASCPVALDYVNSASAGLSGFAATTDGKWGLLDGMLIDLASGNTKPANEGEVGLLGPYVLDACSATSGQDDIRIATIIDPASGQSFSQLGDLSVNDAANCAGSADGDSLPAITFFNELPDQGIDPTGLFYSDSNGTSPLSGLTSDGDGLLVDQANAGPGVGSILLYSLPSMKLVWTASGPYYMWGEGSGVVVATTTDPTSQDMTIDGLNATSGGQMWSTPTTGGAGAVCAVTSSQVLLTINNQYVIVNLETGKQISYSPATSNDGGDVTCPDVLPGGIVATASATEVTVEQAVAP